MEERNLVGVRIDLAVSGGDFCRFALDVDEET